MVALLALVSVFAMAVPNGCYKNYTNSRRGNLVCISGTTFSCTNRDGDVIARWEIVGESDGVLTLRSSLGATATASWWREDGKIYLNWNYETYVHD